VYRTACFKLRVHPHDRRRLATALARWSAGMGEALDRARADQRALLRTLRPRGAGRSAPPGDGMGSDRPARFEVDSRALHARVLGYCRGLPRDLHSALAMALIVAVEGLLGSWLALYAEWLTSGKPAGRKPGFPTVAAGTARGARERWEAALDASRTVLTRAEEDRWRAAVTREARERRMPLYFGAAQSGVRPGHLAHCGLIRRADRKWFAALTLWPKGDPLGETPRRAGNRANRGPLANVRSREEYLPGRATSTMLVPIEMGTGPGRRRKRWERLFPGRGTPKSALLVERDGEYYLHVEFEYPRREPRPTSGAVLALLRGVHTLVAGVLLDARGRRLATTAIDGRDLMRTISALTRLRAIRQRKGRSLAGDRRAARVAEHVLYSAGHQIIDLACRHGAEIVLLEDPGRRRPTPLLRYKHFSRLAEILVQLTEEAGLPPARVRRIYGPSLTCTACGWAPGEPVRVEEAPAPACPGCGRDRELPFHAAELLALDTLRLRTGRKETRPTLPNYVKSVRRNVP